MLCFVEIRNMEFVNTRNMELYLIIRDKFLLLPPAYGTDKNFF